MAQRQRPAPSDLALHPMNEAMLPPDTDLKLSISPSPRPTLIDKQSASGTSPRISVSLDPNDYGRLSELARNSQRSVGWVIRYAVKRFLADGQDPQLQLPLQGAATPFIHKSIDPNGAIADLSAINWQHLRRRHSWTAHHVHPYPTRFAPEVPAKLIEILSQPGNTVLDPYCGSGTTLLEAVRLRRDVIGVDSSPLAILISRVKCRPLTDIDLQAISGLLTLSSIVIQSFRIEERTAQAPKEILQNVREQWLKLGHQKYIPALNDTALVELGWWFPPEAMRELLFIRHVLEECANSAAKDVGMVALSAITISVSFQKSETRLSKCNRTIAPLGTFNRWTKKVQDIVSRLRHSHAAYSLSSVNVRYGHAEDLGFVKPASVDLILTSPPYPQTFDYRAHQKLRLALLGLDTPSTVCETTFPKHHGAPSISSFNQKSYKRELRAALLAMHKVLRLGGICAFIIAASKNKSRNIKDCLIQSGTDAGLDVIGSIKESAFSTLGRLRKRGDPGELLVLFRRIG